MQQLSVIVTLANGQVESIRTHTGLKDEALARQYVELLELAPVGLRVEIWPIDLYSDLGDATPDHQVWRFELAESGWVAY